MTFQIGARLGAATGLDRDQQVAERVRADLLDRAGEDVDGDAELRGKHRQHRVGGVAPGKGDADHLLSGALRALGLQPVGDEARQGHAGDARQERARRGMLGVRKDVVGGALLDDAAAVDHRHVAGDVAHDGHLVGDQQDGQAKIAVDVGQQLQHRLRGLGIERRGGLVRQQHLGPGGQRPGDADALLLPAGKFCRVAPAEILETHARDQVVDPRLDLGAWHAGNLERQRHVAVNGARAQKVEVLEDHPDIAANVAQIGRAGASDIVPGDRHAARGRLLQPVDHAQERRLAGARAPDDSGNCPCRHVETHVLERHDLARALLFKGLSKGREADRGARCLFLGHPSLSLASGLLRAAR